MESLWFKGKSTAAIQRIKRTEVLPATVQLDRRIHQLNRLTKLMKSGGVVLSAASLGVGCYQIGQTDDRQQKNEIFVETLTSTGWGIGAGVIVSAVLISSPVGWGIALVAGAAVAASSWALGKGAKAFYNTKGAEVDLVKLSGTYKWCSEFLIGLPIFSFSRWWL